MEQIRLSANEKIDATRAQVTEQANLEKNRLTEAIQEWQRMYNEMIARHESDKLKNQETTNQEVLAKRQEIDELYAKYNQIMSSKTGVEKELMLMKESSLKEVLKQQLVSCVIWHCFRKSHACPRSVVYPLWS